MDGLKPMGPIPGSVMRLSGMGMELAGAVLGGCLLGYWIDRHFGTANWGLLIGAAIGIVGGLYNMIRKAVRESLAGAGGPRNSQPSRQIDEDIEAKPPTDTRDNM